MLNTYDKFALFGLWPKYWNRVNLSYVLKLMDKKRFIILFSKMLLTLTNVISFSGVFGGRQSVYAYYFQWDRPPVLYP